MKYASTCKVRVKYLRKVAFAKQKKPVIIVGDPILNGINEKGLSRRALSQVYALTLEQQVRTE